MLLQRQEKNEITNNVIKPKLPVSLVTEYVDAEELFIGFNIAVTYDPKLTTSSSDFIKTSILSQVSKHFNANVNELKKNFFFSKLTRELDLVNEVYFGKQHRNEMMKKISFSWYSYSVSIKV